MSIDFPPEFDPSFYRKCKPYLAGFADHALEKEFNIYGKKSGTPGSFMCYRENAIGILRHMPGNILEIGPGRGPDFTGENVKYVDIASREEIDRLYPELPERNGGTPEIDYMMSDMAEGRIKEKFNLIYSAHNFEHQTNCIEHVNALEKLLEPGGLFVAVVPDRNFTFDYYRPTSTLADILSGPKSLTRHSLRSQILYTTTTHNSMIRHWLGEHGEPTDSDQAMIDRCKALTEEDAYKSLHAYTFEPDTFREIFRLLADNGIIKLNLLRVYNTPFGKNEFIAIFQKPAE